jgi:hypothetical protein
MDADEAEISESGGFTGRVKGTPSPTILLPEFDLRLSAFICGF